jgi:hypothetical protein
MDPPPPQVLDYDSRKPRPTRRWQRVIIAAFWIYPPLVPLSFYAPWLAAWLVLGHRPRPNIDDPWQISWIVNVFGYLAVAMLISLLFAFGPAFIAGAILQSKWGRARQRRGKYPASALELAALYLACLIACLILFIFDPLGPLKWFMNW